MSKSRTVRKAEKLGVKFVYAVVELLGKDPVSCTIYRNAEEASQAMNSTANTATCDTRKFIFECPLNF